MKQILQSYRSGQTEIAEVPAPQVKPGQLLIRTHMSLISSGTERSLVQASRKSLAQQAIEQPARIQKAWERVQSEGLLATVDSVRSRSDQMQSLGYCNVGEVVEIGEGVHGFQVGDRVVSNGPHAEYVCVPVNLCARVPEGVRDDEAVFTVLGSIGLQGVRLLAPTLGESFAVMGLGPIGLLCVQLLRANGCRVLALDINKERLSWAEKYGAEIFDLGSEQDLSRVAKDFSRGVGLDGVLITAATQSNEPLHQAAAICRKKGRIVLTGVIGPEFSRADFFEKELSFQVSCSYGPGRYDPVYEQHGVDYPVGYVRWTEQRNFIAYLDLVAAGDVSAAEMMGHRFSVERASEAYDMLNSGAAGIAIGIEYPYAANVPVVRKVRLVDLASATDGRALAAAGAQVGFIGAGNYGAGVLLPAFKRAGAHIVSVGDRGGLLGWLAARKVGAEEATSIPDSLFTDSRLNTLVIATRHDSHGRLVCRALDAGKHVFVEKPLALTEQELVEIEARVGDGRPKLMVGFNRRFAPHVQMAYAHLRDRQEPMSIQITVNAGAIPAGHWVHDEKMGGGRIVGEGCHFVDLMHFLVGHEVVDVKTEVMGLESWSHSPDRVVVVLTFADGSIGTLNYLANGHPAYPKERVEIFCGGRVFCLENFRRYQAFGVKGRARHRLWRQDKGQVACARAFVQAIESGAASPITPRELLHVARVMLKIQAQIKT